MIGSRKIRRPSQRRREASLLCRLIYPKGSNPAVTPDREQMVEPLPHHLLEVIVGAAVRGIAAREKIVLRPAQGTAGGRIGAARIVNPSGIHRVDLAIQTGPFGIAANRLVHRASC